MTQEEGLKEIEDAQWSKDSYGSLNLHVSDDKGRPIHAWLSLRPHYCDRGHIQLMVSGDLELDSADSFPRFFFSAEEAKLHTKTFLKWRIWKHRTHDHTLD